jgi:alkanesulfonate monooxygenase SsuD/methylene tetrahydromethanopterin reductase-like flavin-dependent oxidoreductase (luciferase family)
VTPPRLILVLTENWTITSSRDLRRLVRLSQEAEDAGIDAVMLSDHLVLGRGAGSQGRPANPREYAAPGNQDPATPWPDSVVLMSGIAAATTRIRIVAGAIIAPLRHPILLAHQLAALDLLSEGRLVVQPTVSWHEPEYEALAVPFRLRGKLLDEHLRAWKVLWGPSPATFRGEHYRFDDVYMEPKPYRPGGPRMWFGGRRIAAFIIRRLVEHGHGFHPFGQPSHDDMKPIRDALEAAGRTLADFEFVGGLRPRFPDHIRPASIAEAAEQIPEQLEQGYTSICFNPSQYTDDVDAVPELCRELVARTAALAA